MPRQQLPISGKDHPVSVTPLAAGTGISRHADHSISHYGMADLEVVAKKTRQGESAIRLMTAP